MDLLLFDLPAEDSSWNLVAGDNVACSSEEEELASASVTSFIRAATSTHNMKNQTRSATIKKVGPGLEHVLKKPNIHFRFKHN